MTIWKLLGSIAHGLRPNASINTSKPNRSIDDPESVLHEPSCGDSADDTISGLTIDDTTILRIPFQSESSSNQTKPNPRQSTAIKHAARFLATKIPEQEKQASDIERLQEKIESFTELYTTNDESFSRLSATELEDRIRFIEALVQDIPTISVELSLEEEYANYKRYINSKFKDVAEQFVVSCGDESMNSFATRGNVAEYLEHRDKQSDRKSALTFIRDLATLSKKHHVKGIGELLRVALKHEREHIDDSSNAHGFYRHATSALVLAKLRPQKLTVLEVAAEELQKGGHVYPVPRSVGDVDIWAKENDKDLFIEVKTSVHATLNNRRQLDELIAFARKQDASPILMIGNVQRQIGLARQTQREDVLVENARENIHEIGKLVEEQDGDLRVWDAAGKDVTNTVRGLYRELAKSMLLAKFA